MKKTRLDFSFRRSLALLLCCAGAARGGEMLLTDNNRPNWISNTFDKDEPRLATGATLAWVTDGPYATKSAELLRTGSAPDGQNRVLLDGRRGPEGDCQAFGHWGGGPYYGSFTIDLKNPYNITRAAVWSQQSATRGIESFEVLLSLDGADFVAVGTATPAEDLVNQTEKLGEPITLKLEKPALARYVQFRVKKHPARMQMILSEAAVWGEAPPADATPAALEALRPENRRPEVALRVQAIGSGAAGFAWDGFAGASQVQGYRLYASAAPFARADEAGVERIGEFDAKTVRTVRYPLVPGEARHYGVTAVHPEGEGMAVRSVAHTPPGVLDGRTLGDMLAVNHFWGGGGARFDKRPREWEVVALDLLAETPFRAIRWWRTDPAVVKMFYERGIAVTTFGGAENARNGAELGIYLYGSGNEPHLRGTQPEKHAENVARLRAMVKESVPAAVVYGPTVCLDNVSLDWLARFYAAGGGAAVDAVDVHSYLGDTADFRRPEGYPSGSPEGLFERVEKIRAVMAEHGDADKPLICTEFGYTDATVANPAGEMTPERKAAFLSRGLILHHVLGFRRVFAYSFWDEGTDPHYTEHHFGVVSADFQKKPAFFALRALADTLGDCVYERPMDGADATNFGYVYRRDGDGDRFVTVAWNGAGPRRATFAAPAGTEIEIVGTTGGRRRIAVGADGRFRARLGPGPRYFAATAPVALLESLPAAEAGAGEALGLRPLAPVAVTGAGVAQALEFEIRNPTRERVQARLALAGADGVERAARDLVLEPGAVAVEGFDAPAPAGGLILERYAAALRYEGADETRSTSASVFVRRLAAKPGVTTARMAGYDRDIYVLADEALEITIDPFRGGRILEIIDRRDGQNQVTADYELLGGLENVAFRYGIWDQVKAPHSKGLGRSDPYTAKPLAEGIGLELSAGAEDGLRLVKRLRLDGDGRLAWEAELHNGAAESVACSYYLHPEYTVGGTADSHADLLRLPLAGKETTIPYWSGLGERPTEAFSAGYWIFEDPKAAYAIRQDFSLDEFRTPRLWFGVGCCNVEMESAKDLSLPPGGSWRGTLHWRFGPP